MGVYGSPDTGNLYTDKEEKKGKPEGHKPQKNLWVWISIIIINMLFYLVSEKTLADILTLIVLDSVIIFAVSIISLFVNLIKKKRIGNDLKYIGISIIVFLIFIMILGTL